MDQNDLAIVNTATWADGHTAYQLEDKVAVADPYVGFLQGLVLYVGPLLHDGADPEDLYVGIQLTGPSIGKGFCNGNHQGHLYFANVGKHNGVLVPLSQVAPRLGTKTGNAALDLQQAERQTTESTAVDLELIDCLTEARADSILQHYAAYEAEIIQQQKKRKNKKKNVGEAIISFFKGEPSYMEPPPHVQRLRDERYEAEGGIPIPLNMGAETDDDGEDGSEDSATSPPPPPPLTFATADAKLVACDVELCTSLLVSQQNYCLSDPTLPDNPIVFASQPFLNMTGYSLHEIVGRNCRFLQSKHAEGTGAAKTRGEQVKEATTKEQEEDKKEAAAYETDDEEEFDDNPYNITETRTDPCHVDRIRYAVNHGTDCNVCLLNFRRDGTPFYNRLFTTALRDEAGNVKYYLGVQCEVTPEVAHAINYREQLKFERGDIVVETDPEFGMDDFQKRKKRKQRSKKAIAMHKKKKAAAQKEALTNYKAMVEERRAKMEKLAKKKKKKKSLKKKKQKDKAKKTIATTAESEE